MHNKKLMVVAVATALAAPVTALAQSSTVQIFGLINQNISWIDQGGNRIKTDLQNNHDSEIGVRGEEQLGGNLAAWFQCASTLDLNAGGNQTLCGRNSAVGFKGNFGNVFVGLWNTPLRDLIQIPLRPVIAPGGGTSEILFNADAFAGNNATNSGSQFGRRQKNFIQYWSPNWNGFELRAGITNTNEATGQTTATTASKPRMWTVAGRYVNGPVYIAGGYEHHSNFNPMVNVPTGASAALLTATTAASGAYRGGDDSMWTIAGQYTFAGVFKLIGHYNWLKYDTNAGGINNLDAKTWAVYGNWQIQGPHQVSVGYSKLRDTSGTAGCGPAGVATATSPFLVGTWTANCGAGGTGAAYWQAQYGYSWSKRTLTYIGYSKVDNDANAVLRVQYQGAGLSAPPGEDQSAWTIGIRHFF